MDVKRLRSRFLADGERLKAAEDVFFGIFKEFVDLLSDVRG